MSFNLENFIKYCQEYVSLTTQGRRISQEKYAVDISQDYLSLIGLLNGETDGSLSELVKLDTFYAYNPDDVPEELQDEYNKQKRLAIKIDEIYNKHENDSYTKQVQLNFGYFKLEIPLEDEIDEEEGAARKTEDKFPLFSIQVKIEKSSDNKYNIYTVDPHVQVNIFLLESVLEESQYIELTKFLGRLEEDDKLLLPIIEESIFREVWDRVKSTLKLKEDISFGERSFNLTDLKIALSSRANFFLAEDLRKLLDKEMGDLEKTSLSSWGSDEGLLGETSMPSEREVFFPFLFDKFKLKILKHLNKKSFIVEGPPGTGKSETIANLLCHLASQNKKVLFVSQKAQALKVVKDKLNGLNLKYLYGYIPNPSSVQLTEADENDGISAQLSGLQSYVNKISHGESPSSLVKEFEELISNKEVLTNDYNQSIDNQRKYFSAYKKLQKLLDFDFKIDNYKYFFNNLTAENYDDLSKNYKKIKSLEKKISNYENKFEKEKKVLDSKFGDVLGISENNHSKYIREIWNDYKEYGFDRKNKLLRYAKNISRKIRRREEYSKLPREVFEYLEKQTSSDSLKTTVSKNIEKILNHVEYKENIEALRKLKDVFGTQVENVGLTEAQFLEMIAIQDKFGLKTKDLKENRVKIETLRQELDRLQGGNIKKIKDGVSEADKFRRAKIALFIQNIINKNIQEKFNSVTVKRIIARLAKAFGKSKKAFKTFDKIRKDPDNFNSILDLIPVWIMELDDASRIVPLESNLFDYVILDEASQCNIAYTIPSMYRAKNAILVGDSEQMRDTSVRFKSNRKFDELANKFQIPEDMRIKSSGNSVLSVLDIASLRGISSVPLRYHYRSPRELIGFSNEYFYKPKGKELIPINTNYFVYGDTNRIMNIHNVVVDWSKEITEKVNVSEAQEILSFFKGLKSDEKYSDKSIAILTFFNEQASYLREIFDKEGFDEVKDNYKISIVEGIQGDEKDIVIYSFVIKEVDEVNRYRPLTGEGGDVAGDINRGRVNVAFSRARLQTHCFVSLETSKFPEKIWIKKYLKYVEKNGGIDFFSLDLKEFDSFFEEEFYSLMKETLGDDYIIQNQVKSCGFKIDFVISNKKNNRRIAVECDGPTHFKDELDDELGIYVESDLERQQVLESAGWVFYRIKYSDWVDWKHNERKNLAKKIKELLS